MQNQTELSDRCTLDTRLFISSMPLDIETPFGRALSFTGPVRRVASERALDVLIAAPASGGTRTVTKHGIFLGGRKGEIMAIKITPGNTDDRAVLDAMTGELKGKVLADKVMSTDPTCLAKQRSA